MLDDIKNKVQRLLAANFNVRLGKRGNWIIDHGSTSVMVEVDSFRAGDAELGRVRLNAPLLYKVKLTPEVFRWIAVDGNFKFGSVNALENSDEPGTGMLSFHYSIIGVDLDESELEHAVRVVAITANRLDTELQAKFGGEKLRDDV